MAGISSAGRRRLLVTDYDAKVDQRVAKHECLRNRNNSTSCRSPGREDETEKQKTKQQKKRHQEFLKRRQIEDTETPLVSEDVRSKEPKVLLRTNRRRIPALNRRSIVKAQDLGIVWPDVGSVEQGTPLVSQRSERRSAQEQATYLTLSTNPAPLFTNPSPLSTNPAPLFTNPSLLSTNPAPLFTNPAPLSTNPTSLSTNPTPLSSPSPLTFPLLPGNLDRLKRDRGVQTFSKQHTQDASAQTQSGLITVKESDLQKLADYLQEALQREKCLKKKLALLQCHASTLLQSSDKLRTSRCDEDLMKSRIGVLESQLQICTQELPRDGVKKLVLQMEEQRRAYEQKALAALQKATAEKSEAEERAESLQVALQAAKDESAQWQSLYEGLKENCGQMRSNQERSTDLLHQQQNQLEAAAGQKAELTDHLVALQRDSEELRARIAFLEEDNQVKMEQLQEMREKLWHCEDPGLTENFFQSSESRGPVAQLLMSDGSSAAGRLYQDGAQLQDTLEKLGMKEKECVELRAELEAMEHECHSCQSRLAQCREELRQLTVRKSKRRCSSWLCVALLLLLAVVSVALVCVCHPPCSHSLRDLLGVLQQRVEQYLHEMASPELSGCYRPI